MWNYYPFSSPLHFILRKYKLFTVVSLRLTQVYIYFWGGGGMENNSGRSRHLNPSRVLRKKQKREKILRATRRFNVSRTSDLRHCETGWYLFLAYRQTHERWARVALVKAGNEDRSSEAVAMYRIFNPFWIKKFSSGRRYSRCVTHRS
jgi:hypothetical protein